MSTEREEYRDFTIHFDPPPIPARTMDWYGVHKDYDGPEDDRLFYAGSRKDVKSAIDDWHKDRIP